MLDTTTTQDPEESTTDIECMEDTQDSSSDGSSNITIKKGTKRVKTSLIWGHVHSDEKEPLFLFCNHCNTKWSDAGCGNSTSTIRTHMIGKHRNKLTEEELASIST